MALRYALATGCFKTREDGSKVFFPWGPGAVGYIIPTEKRFERLQEQMSAWLGLALPLAVFFTMFLMLGFGTPWPKLFIGLVIALAYIGAFAVWVRIQCGSLVAADEKLALSEWATIAANNFSRFRLYVHVLTDVAFLVVSLYIIAARPMPQGILGLMVMDLYFAFDAVGHARILQEQRHRAVPSP